VLCAHTVIPDFTNRCNACQNAFEIGQLNTIQSKNNSSSTREDQAHNYSVSVFSQVLIYQNGRTRLRRNQFSTTHPKPHTVMNRLSTSHDPSHSCWVCRFLLRTIPWCHPTILCMVFLSSSLPPSFQTSPPSPVYCPSSCTCVQTGLASFPWSVAPCSSCIALFCALLHS